MFATKQCKAILKDFLKKLISKNNVLGPKEVLALISLNLVLLNLMCVDWCFCTSAFWFSLR